MRILFLKARNEGTVSDENGKFYLNLTKHIKKLQLHLWDIPLKMLN